MSWPAGEANSLPSLQNHVTGVGLHGHVIVGGLHSLVYTSITVILRNKIAPFTVRCAYSRAVKWVVTSQSSMFIDHNDVKIEMHNARIVLVDNQ